jgi:polar amino acid transport system ATP-binding protein
MSDSFSPNIRSARPLDSAVEVVHLGAMLGDRVILEDISFWIPKGQIVGILGSSGSGKSTLLRCIQGLHKISQGHIKCHGRMGFMFQDFQLFPHMSVYDNLTYAPRLHRLPHVQKHAQDIMVRLGLSALQHRLPQELSGGQKQRVALARSLMMQPDVLLCDEPTSGLDIRAIQDIQNLFQNLRDQGMTLCIASHDLEFLLHLVDRVFVLKQGKLILDCMPKDLTDPLGDLRQTYE